MEMLARIENSNEGSCDRIIKSSFLNLVNYAQTTLPEETQQEFFRSCIDILEESLHRVEEATEIIKLIEKTAKAAKPQQRSLDFQLIEIPEHGDLVLDLTSVDHLSSAVIARCLTVRKIMAARGARLVLSGVNDDLRDSLEAVQFDKMFEIHYSGSSQSLACPQQAEALL